MDRTFKRVKNSWYLMLYKPNYIISIDLFPAIGHSLADKNITLDIRSNTSGDLSKAYSISNELDTSTNFSLLVSEPHSIDSNWAQAVVSFFFFKNYYRFGQLPILLVEGSGFDRLNKMRDIIRQFAHAQGFEDVEIVMLQKNNDGELLIPATAGESVIKLSYRQQLTSMQDGFESVFIILSDNDQVSLVERYLNEEEKLFQQQNADLYNLKCVNTELGKRANEMAELVKALENENKALTSHNSILRSGSQAKVLQRYYTYEYEVLPKWYKRFGHLIKVITGKRTFGSLFDKSQKKYKE